MRHYKIHELLSRDELDQLEAFTREPGRTLDEITDWLLAHGFTVSRGAVHAWRRDFLARDRYVAASETARSIIGAANRDTPAIADAAALQLSQMIFEQTLCMQEEGKIDTANLWKASMALKNVVASAAVVNELKDRQKQAIDEAQKLASEGGSAESAVKKMREILGIQ